MGVCGREGSKCLEKIKATKLSPDETWKKGLHSKSHLCGLSRRLCDSNNNHKGQDVPGHKGQESPLTSQKGRKMGLMEIFKETLNHVRKS